MSTDEAKSALFDQGGELVVAARAMHAAAAAHAKVASDGGVCPATSQPTVSVQAALLDAVAVMADYPLPRTPEAKTEQAKQAQAAQRKAEKAARKAAAKANDDAAKGWKAKVVYVEADADVSDMPASTSAPPKTSTTPASAKRAPKKAKRKSL